MTRCLVTRSAAIITLDDGRQIEISRSASDPPEAVLTQIRGVLVLDEVRVDLSIP